MASRPHFDPCLGVETACTSDLNGDRPMDVAMLKTEKTQIRKQPKNSTQKAPTS